MSHISRCLHQQCTAWLDQQTCSLSDCLRRFVDRRWQLPGWGYPLCLLPNSFKWNLTARRLSTWSVDRPGRRVDLAYAAHHVGNTRLLVEKPDSEAVGGRNKFMTHLPRKLLSREDYRPEDDVKSGSPEPIPVKPRNCNWELSTFCGDCADREFNRGWLRSVPAAWPRMQHLIR